MFDVPSLKEQLMQKHIYKIFVHAKIGEIWEIAGN